MEQFTTLWKSLKSQSKQNRLNEDQVNEAYSEKLKQKAKNLVEKDHKNAYDRRVKDALGDIDTYENDIYREFKKNKSTPIQTVEQKDHYRGAVTKAIDRKLAKEDPEYARKRRAPMSKEEQKEQKWHSVVKEDPEYGPSRDTVNKRYRDMKDRLAEKGIKGRTPESLAKSYRKYKSSNEEFIAFAEHVRSLSEEEFADYIVTLFESNDSISEWDIEKLFRKVFNPYTEAWAGEWLGRMYMHSDQDTTVEEDGDGKFKVKLGIGEPDVVDWRVNFDVIIEGDYAIIRLVSINDSEFKKYEGSEVKVSLDSKEEIFRDLQKAIEDKYEDVADKIASEEDED